MDDTKAALAAAKERLAAYAKAAPGTMKGFAEVTRVATTGGSFRPAQKELMATAIAVATGCEDCILYHLDGARRHGADEAALVEALAVAVEMGGGPAVMYAGKALAAFRDSPEGAKQRRGEATMAHYLTADGGTESLRARVYDLSGACLGQMAVPYVTTFSAGARAEQNPEDWWDALVVATAGAIADAGVPADSIEAMCFATTSCTVVALDGTGRALRPALMWMDVRSHAEADAVLATGDPALKINGAGHGPVSAEWMIPKALWLKINEPAIFDAAATICEYQDFLTYRLTGERCASLDNAGLRWHYDNRGGGWARGILRALDLEALEAKWPARVVAPGEVVGTLTAAAAAALGLRLTVKVVQGGADALIGMIGLGVAKPGQLALITGSSHLLFGVTEAPIHAPGVWGAYPDIVYPGRWIVEGGQTSTGSIINWLRRFSGGSLDLAALNEAAAALEPGCDGLIVQDHFQGNRTPYTDPLSRGAIVGLTLAHEPHHVFRAIMEGIGFGTRAILDAFRAGGYASNEITVGGGATSSPLWMQIHADTAGLPVRIPASPDAPSTGSAVLAAHGAGRFASIDEGIAAMVRRGVSIEPRQREVELYEEIYQKYLALYPVLRQALAAGHDRAAQPEHAV